MVWVEINGMSVKQEGQKDNTYTSNAKTIRGIDDKDRKTKGERAHCSTCIVTPLL